MLPKRLPSTFIMTPTKDLAGDTATHGSVNNSHPLPTPPHVQYNRIWAFKESTHM